MNSTPTTTWSDGIPESNWVKIRPGDRVRLKVLDRTMRPSNLNKDRDGNPLNEVLATVEIDGEARPWTPNIGALRALEAARVANGDVIDVERHADTAGSGGFTQSNWTITKVALNDFAAGRGGDDDVVPF